MTNNNDNPTGDIRGDRGAARGEPPSNELSNDDDSLFSKSSVETTAAAKAEGGAGGLNPEAKAFNPEARVFERVGDSPEGRGIEGRFDVVQTMRQAGVGPDPNAETWEPETWELTADTWEDHIVGNLPLISQGDREVYEEEYDSWDDPNPDPRPTEEDLEIMRLQNEKSAEENRLLSISMRKRREEEDKRREASMKIMRARPGYTSSSDDSYPCRSKAPSRGRHKWQWNPGTATEDGQATGRPLAGHNDVLVNEGELQLEARLNIEIDADAKSGLDRKLTATLEPTEENHISTGYDADFPQLQGSVSSNRDSAISNSDKWEQFTIDRNPAINPFTRSNPSNSGKHSITLARGSKRRTIIQANNLPKDKKKKEAITVNNAGWKLSDQDEKTWTLVERGNYGNNPTLDLISDPTISPTAAECRKNENENEETNARSVNAFSVLGQEADESFQREALGTAAYSKIHTLAPDHARMITAMLVDADNDIATILSTLEDPAQFNLAVNEGIVRATKEKAAWTSVQLEAETDLQKSLASSVLSEEDADEVVKQLRLVTQGLPFGKIAGQKQICLDQPGINSQTKRDDDNTSDDEVVESIRGGGSAEKTSKKKTKKSKSSGEKKEKKEKKSKKAEAADAKVIKRGEKEKRKKDKVEKARSAPSIKSKTRDSSTEKKGKKTQSLIDSSTVYDNSRVTLINADDGPIRGRDEPFPNSLPSKALSDAIRRHRSTTDYCFNGDMKELGPNDQVRLLLTIIWDKASTPPGVPATDDQRKIVSDHLQFQDVDTLREVARSVSKSTNFAKAASFSVISRTEMSISPLAVTELIPAEIRQLAMDGRRGDLLEAAQIFLRRVSEFGEKEGLPLLLKLSTPELSDLVCKPGKLVLYLRRNNVSLEYDPPCAMRITNLHPIGTLGNPMESFASPNMVIHSNESELRKLGPTDRNSAMTICMEQFLRRANPLHSMKMMRVYRGLSVDMKLKCIFTNRYFIEVFREQFKFLDPDFVPGPTTPRAQPKSHTNMSDRSKSQSLAPNYQSGCHRKAGPPGPYFRHDPDYVPFKAGATTPKNKPSPLPPSSVNDGHKVWRVVVERGKKSPKEVLRPIQMVHSATDMLTKMTRKSGCSIKFVGGRNLPKGTSLTFTT